MNATTVDVAGRKLAIHPQRTLLGLRNLLRKDAIDWLRSKRPWIVIVVSLFVFLPAAANSRINEWIIRNFPTAETSSKVVSLQPMDNLMQAIGTQFIVIAVIFATMSLLLAERDSGTLAWTISKPVSRTSVLVSKWITSTLILWVAAVVIPLVATTVLVSVLYGMPDMAIVGRLGVNLLAVPALYVAITLAAATLVPSQAAVGAIGLGIFAGAQLLGGIVPSLAPFFPTSIFGWAIEASAGGSPSLATPVAWFAGMVALFLIARNRLDAMDL